MDFSGSNVDDCFNGAEEGSPKDDAWIVFIFSHVNNNLQPFGMSDLPSGARSSFLVRNSDLSLLGILNIVTKSRLSFLNLVTVPKMSNLSLTPLKLSCHPQHDMRDAVLKYAIALLNK